MKGVVFAALLSLVAGLEIRKPHRCGDPAAGPVLGGADLVQLREHYESNDGTVVLPVFGEEKYSASFDKYTFWFTSDENAKKFSAAPSNYYPQFGGYCTWGLTGYDKHVSDPSGFSLAGACMNSTFGFQFYTSETSTTGLENFWYLIEEAKDDMNCAGAGLETNIKLARENFQTILNENDNASFCFNTDQIKTCA